MKNYSADFKADAVALYHSRPDAPIRSAAQDLGVNPDDSARSPLAGGQRVDRGDVEHE